MKKKFYANLKNFKLLSLIFLLLIVTFYFFSYFLISPNNINKDNFSTCISQSEIINLDFEIKYEDISIFPELQNIKCLGQPYKLDIENNILYIGFSSKLYNLFLYFLQILFFLLIYFKKPEKKVENVILLVLILFFSFIYRFNVFIATGMSTYGSIGENPFELKYDITILFILLLLKHFENKSLLLILFFYINIFKPSLFGFLVIFLFIRFKLNLNLNNFQKKLFLAFPIFKYLLWLISIPFEKFNILWLSFIQDPYSGLQRLPDMWLTLVPLKCINDSSYSTLFYFSDFKMVCPQDFYNPIFRFFNLSLDVWTTIIIFSIIFYISFLYLYQYLLKIYEKNKTIVAIFFLMPPVNFLFVTGNFDLITMFLGFFALRINKKQNFISSLIILFISLMEIHPVSILFGLLAYSLYKFDIKKMFINLFSIITFFYFIFTHNSSVSIQNQFFSENSFGFNFEYVANQGAGFGLMLDLPKLFVGMSTGYSLLISSLILLILFLLFLFKGNILQSKQTLFNSKTITDYEIIGYASWLFFSFIFANQAYRLSNFFIIFLILFSANRFKTKLFVILCCFLTPATLIYGNQVFAVIILFQRIGLFYIILILLSEVTQQLKSINNAE